MIFYTLLIWLTWEGKGQSWDYSRLILTVIFIADFIIFPDQLWLAGTKFTIIWVINYLTKALGYELLTMALFLGANDVRRDWVRIIIKYLEIFCYFKNEWKLIKKIWITFFMEMLLLANEVVAGLGVETDVVEASVETKGVVVGTTRIPGEVVSTTALGWQV